VKQVSTRIQALAEPILVGRERELERLHSFLDKTKEGKGQTVFVSAEAGVGKTRLLQDFLNFEKKEDIVILSGWCLFNAGVPYFPFIEAFSNYYAALGEKTGREELELNSWLKGPVKAEFSENLMYLSPQALKDQTFVAVCKTIRSIASQKQVILVLEDIHWADSASLALLHYIARAVKNSKKVLILATFRSEELIHDSEGYPNQLVATLATMRRDDLFEQINLSNLDPINITKMAESMLGDTLQQALAEELAVKSEGNPLFVVESIRMLHEQKSLIHENNEWHLALEEIDIPSKIRDIVIQRLACLNSVQRRFLEAASVVGEEFEVGLLSAVVRQDSLDILEMLNIIAQSTSIICADEEKFRFDHSRSREIIYGMVAGPLKQGYHKMIAEKLESLRSDLMPYRDLAYHYSQAGNKNKAVSYALAAGQNELMRWSNKEAAEHFTFVLDAIKKDFERSSTKKKRLKD
jgi:predicted ATPase